MKIKELTLAFLLAIGALEVEANHCIAIAFSSGNQQVAFQAGALKAIISSLQPAERAYTHVSGVGGGAVNAAILSHFAPGQEA